MRHQDGRSIESSSHNRSTIHPSIEHQSTKNESYAICVWLRGSSSRRYLFDHLVDVGRQQLLDRHADMLSVPRQILQDLGAVSNVSNTGPPVIRELQQLGQVLEDHATASAASESESEAC